MKRIQIDDYEVNNPPYEEVSRLWDKAEKLKIPDYKKKTIEELKKVINKARSE